MSGKTTGQQENDAARVGRWSAAAAARLKQAIKRSGGVKHVAEAVGMSRQSLFEILRFDEATGIGSRPTKRNFSLLLQTVGYTPDAILGSIDQGEISTFISDYERFPAELVPVQRYRAIASAGGGLIPLAEGSDEAMAFPRRWLSEIGVSPAHAALMEVKGDSMLPTIPERSLVLLHQTDEVHGPAIYVFSRDGTVAVKRLHPLAREENGQIAGLAIISDNPAYQPETVSGEEMNSIRIIGRVRLVMAAV